MDISLSDLPSWAGTLLQSQLLAAALAAMALSTLGGLIRRPLPHLGRVLRFGGNLALLGVLGLTALQVMRISNPSFELALPGLGMPRQSVEGQETHIPMGPDGHFWVEALVNGEPRRFLVDTGATLTAVSQDWARQGGINPAEGRMPVQLRTANGSLPAQLGTIRELAFGNIVARDLDAVIAPGMEGVNVLGMNFLSRLKGWRVEEGVLILEPRVPQEG
ncbi:TIGR02281 family clan AA aspartic protease [Novosphingobium tardum]|uniref:TIGR02281 family clan AA aspartic protease n=1 Tax=Novosphingobium tardum TaxID=1538021 RepID=A0ABV8RRR4_9SPHN